MLKMLWFSISREYVPFVTKLFISRMQNIPFVILVYLRLGNLDTTFFSTPSKYTLLIELPHFVIQPTIDVGESSINRKIKIYECECRRKSLKTYQLI